jgi:hypothetical protein
MKIKGEDILFAILVALTCLGLLTSCEYEPIDDPVIYEWYIDEDNLFEPQAIIITDSKYQHVYLSTEQEYTYFQIYAEANEMPEHKRYNGENNIWASFSTPKYWNYSDGNIDDEPVYAISLLLLFVLIILEYLMVVPRDTNPNFWIYTLNRMSGLFRYKR